MFDKLEIFKMASGMATHAAHRHSVLARNIAHADTPGYRARDIAPFAETYQQSDSFAAKATRAAHLAGTAPAHNAPTFERAGELDPNGNSVSLETEMMKSVEARRQHNMALTIYKTSLGILRSSIGR